MGCPADAGLRGRRGQPNEPDPGHAGGGRRDAAFRSRNARRVSRNELPQVAAALLDAPARARPRVHCITNAVAQNFTANVLLAAGCVPSMTLSRRGDRGRSLPARDALLVNLGTFDRERREATAIAVEAARAGQRALGARSGVHRPQRRRARPSRASWSRARPRAMRLNRAEFAALAGSEPIARSAGGLRARARGSWSRCRARPIWISDGERLAIDRQRPSADGQGDGHGLRRLGAGRRPVLRVEAGRLARDRGRAADDRRRRRNGGARRRKGPGSFAVAIIDALHNLDGRDRSSRRARVN